MLSRYHSMTDASATAGPAGPSGASGVAARVLIVDDDTRLLFVLESQFTAAGFEVTTAKRGEEALRMASAQIPDLILMDLAMPDMNGITVTRRLKESSVTNHIPIVILTASWDPDHLVDALEAGAEEYLRKPFEFRELIARVRIVLRLAKDRQELDHNNLRLMRAVEKKTRRLELLNELQHNLNIAGSQDEILDHIIHAVQRATESDRISLMLKHEAQDELICARAVGIQPDLVPNIRISALHGVAGQVFSSGKTFVAKALSGDTDGAERYVTDEFMSTPLMCTSMSTGGEILGVLNVTEKKDGTPFVEEEIDCIRAIADSGAIALHNDMVRQRLRNSIRALLLTIGRLAEYRDDDTAEHVHRVSKYAEILATDLARSSAYADAISDEFVANLVQAAPMHDIGKVGIPDDILMKKGQLTDEEFAIMKSHTLIGYQVLECAYRETGGAPLLQMCIDIAHCHHERFDGTGYPRRLRGEDIPLAARIIAVVDAYDAITTARPYKVAKDHAHAVRAIESDSGRHFDPEIVESFMRCESEFEVLSSQNAREEFMSPASSMIPSP